MDWLRFEGISVLPNSSIGQLCEDLNEIVGQGIYYNRFEIQNTKWLWFVSNMITAMNNDKTLCGCFVMYPRFVAGILNSARRIHLFLCSVMKSYIMKIILKSVLVTKSVVFVTSRIQDIISNYHQSETIFISFETRLFPKLPSEIVFA